jgi:hypothetical protein
MLQLLFSITLTAHFELRKIQVVSKSGREVDSISIINQDTYLDVIFKTPEEKQSWVDGFIQAKNIITEKEKFFEDSNKMSLD